MLPASVLTVAAVISVPYLTLAGNVITHPPVPSWIIFKISFSISGVPTNVNVMSSSASISALVPSDQSTSTLAAEDQI